jgi:hypothetical protein
LYFTSNEELIGLMGNLSNQTHLQAFLGKLFEGIAGLVFVEGNIVAIRSASQEELKLQKPISTEMPPEMWLKEIEVGMKWALYTLIEQALADFVLKEEESEIG